MMKLCYCASTLTPNGSFGFQNMVKWFCIAVSLGNRFVERKKNRRGGAREVD
jgi:hypothetical protein